MYAQIDVVTLLQLDKYLDQKKLQTTVYGLMQEVANRILTEELPKHFKPEEFTIVKQKLIEVKDILVFSAWLDENYPTIKISDMVESVFFTLKKEFIIVYLENLKNSLKQKLTHSDNRKIESLLGEVREILNDTNFNIEILAEKVGSMLFYQNYPILESSEDKMKSVIKEKLLHTIGKEQILLEKKAFSEQFNALNKQYQSTYSQDEKREILKRMRTLISKFELIIQATTETTTTKYV